MKPKWAVGQTHRETGLLEDLCKHGIGHPNEEWLKTNDPNNKRRFAIHGCDGCCYDRSTVKMYKLRDIADEEYESEYPGTLGGNKALKIYGRLTCRNALMWIEKGHYVKQRVFFINEVTAKAAGYRPCAICMLDEYLEWKNK